MELDQFISMCIEINLISKNAHHSIFDQKSEIITYYRYVVNVKIFKTKDIHVQINNV